MHQHTFKHFGFTTTPYGTMDDILNQIDFDEAKIFYIIDPLTGTELPYDEIKSLPKENLFKRLQYLGFNVTEELVQWKSYFKNLGVAN
jgi:hypothetical protein